MAERITGIEITFVGLFEGVQRPDFNPALASIRSVEIPLIQRDYAQGRSTPKVEDIRLAFLDALRDAVLTDQRLSLDFVYGGVTNGVLRPLDGQQRLTTLFLLHWYLANRSARTTANAEWGSFAYDTRPSARRFCRLLMESSPPPDDRWDDLSGWLVDQPWYLYVWEQDPTISSMLVMLDAIHEVFRDVDAAVAWDRLTDASEPAISFFVLPIEEVGAGDELYIKMNSRGKPLTEFETFKARVLQEIRPQERSARVAHKFDGAWTDVLWPHHGGDNIVDDEFLRYIEFLVDLGEWRAGISSEGRLLTRATRLLGGESQSSTEGLHFFERAFDTWSGVSIDDYFAGLFRRPDARPDPDDLRPTLFTPEWLDGVNLFEMCCQNYGSMLGDRVRAFPLGLTILLYGVLIHRLEQTEDFSSRLRVLRNLVESSGNEIRVERMPEHLRDVEALMRTGDVAAVKSFNQVQVADEVRKAEFLNQYPGARQPLARLEDHPLLRGTLTAFDLDPATVEARARAFAEVFEDNTDWLTLTGALLASGDYFRRRNSNSFQFGSPTTESWWRTLLAGAARTPLEQVREPLGRLLDQVAERDRALGDVYSGIISSWLSQREAAHHFDWRYHFVKYPAMREGTSGIYVTENSELGYAVCAMKRTNLNSNYRDPYLLAIHRSLGVDRFRVEDPWFTGSARNPRRLRIRRTDISLRSVQEGLEIDVPAELVGRVGALLQGVAELEERRDGYRWIAPQQIAAGEPVDTVDRVAVGTRILQRLLNGLDARDLWDDVGDELDVRAHMLATLIASRLDEAGELCRRWITIPRDGSGAWVAFELAEGPCIELVLLATDDVRIALKVIAYPSYGRFASLFPEFDYVPLGVGWTASDAEIVGAFMGHVATVRSRSPKP